MKRADLRDCRGGASAKQQLVAKARIFGVLPALEVVKFARSALETASDNRLYRERNPSFRPPPLWWMHDMYSHTSYQRYALTGEETARELTARIDRFSRDERPRLADWGCGLGRVTRHLAALYDVTGFDYNKQAVAWCRSAIPSSTFRLCNIAPPLPAENQSFDVVTALSVFTHLSARGHRLWISEVLRVLKPGGLFLGSFHVSPREGQLLKKEQEAFEAGRLVVRGHVKEGARIYTAYHPEGYLLGSFLDGFEVLEGPVPFFGQGLLCARKL